MNFPPFTKLTPAQIYSGDDTLVGTMGDNTVNGFGGNDILWGDTSGNLSSGQHGGNDTLIGGAGNNFIYGDAHDLAGTINYDPYLVTAGGNDTLWADGPNLSDIGGHNSLFGDSIYMYGYSHGGNDHLYDATLGSVTTAYGDAQFMSGHAIGGDDYISGLAQTSTLYGDAQNINGDPGGSGIVGGNDTLVFYSAHGEAYGDALQLQGYVRCGDDTIIIGDQGASVYGDAGQTNAVQAAGGNDTIAGGNGNDTIYGDFGANGNTASGGNDTIYGGGGNDTIYGDCATSTATWVSSGSDTIDGGAGNDTIYGDLGRGTNGVVPHLAVDAPDFITGGAGNDQMWGGGGADRFIFAPGSGQDLIMDFTQAEGDKIDLTAYHLNATFGAGGVTLTSDWAGDAIVNLPSADDGSSQYVILAGIHPQQLTLSDFLFT